VAVDINKGIAASELERELRESRAIAVLDVRSKADASAWPLPTGDVPLISIPLADLQGDHAAALARLPGVPLRVICSRGNSSRRAVAELAAHGIEATNVNGGMQAWGALLTASPLTVGAATVVQFRREARGCLSYLVCGEHDALAVDPAPAIEAYLDEARDRGVRITVVLDTHVHADHVSGARALADATDAALHMSAAALARGVTFADRVSAVADGDVLPLAGISARIVSLPGHTTDNVGVLVEGRALLAGDSLFVDAVARPDLEAGDAGAAAAAHTLFRTLRGRVLALDDATILLPCHYPGGRRETAVLDTIGGVRDRVAALALDEDAFVAAIVEGLPPRPANYTRVIEANLGADDDADAGMLEVGANNCAAGAG